MKYAKLLAITFFIALIVNCAKNDSFRSDNHVVKVINGKKMIINQSVPSIPNDSLAVNLKLKHKIILADHNLKWSFITRDDEGNIYLTNRDNPAQVFTCKFDSTGKFITRFGMKGSGPGEISQFVINSLCFNENLYLSDMWTSVNIYNLEGDYLREIRYCDLGFDIKSANELDSTRIIAEIFYREKSESEVYEVRSVCILDKDLSIKKVLKKVSFPNGYEKGTMNCDELNFKYSYFTYTNNTKNIFIATKNNNSYYVEVFDNSGNLEYTFSKKFRKLKYGIFEKMLVKKILKKRDEYSSNLVKYKNIIKSMDFDKKGRLWIHVNDENGSDMKFDVFDKGVYLNSVELDFKFEGDYVKYYNLLGFSEKYLFGNQEFLFYNDGEIKVFCY
ncbi:MAG: 6-bladed beta-propeller [Candidatus Delongbacteria bacterium]|jgi:hypothetical protein|nr:6-bladed beta-propeller [Candidatus Delongbacteria bacterium]